MPRLTLTADNSPGQDEPTVLFDEHVQSIHLASGHSAAQLIERLAWAILDAEQADRTPKPVRAHEPDLCSQQDNRQASRERALHETRRLRALQSAVSLIIAVGIW